MRLSDRKQRFVAQDLNRNISKTPSSHGKSGQFLILFEPTKQYLCGNLWFLNIILLGAFKKLFILQISVVQETNHGLVYKVTTFEQLTVQQLSNDMALKCKQKLLEKVTK